VEQRLLLASWNCRRTTAISSSRFTITCPWSSPIRRPLERRHRPPLRRYLGTDAEKRKVDEDFALVQKWSKTQDRPILLGEFGAYDGAAAPWMTAPATPPMSPAPPNLLAGLDLLQFDSDFIVYDMARTIGSLPSGKPWYRENSRQPSAISHQLCGAALPQAAGCLA